MNLPKIKKQKKTLLNTQSQILYKKLQQKYSRKIDLDLKRINIALKKLNNIHHLINNPINIIGSDGKFSTLRSLQFFIEENRQKVSAFTSPHLYDIRHRFWLKNKYISINELKQNIKTIEKLKVKLTLFELLTLAYYISASKLKKISYSLVEAGLLFAGESTRVWDKPKCQIVTNINKQHLEWVKPRTLKEICRQKVGYLSKNTTIYIGKQNKKTMKIIKEILKKNPSKKIFHGDDWSLKETRKNIIYKDKIGQLEFKSKNILSKGLWDNIGLSIKVARDFNITNKVILKSIPKIHFEGRMQYLNNGKLKKILQPADQLLIDGCHSESSAKNLANYLKNLDGDIYGILGIQSNKQPEQIIKQFKGIFKGIVAIKIPEEPNTCNPEVLKRMIKKYGVACSTASSVQLAFKQIANNKKKKLVVCFGSLYLVGKILSLN